MKDLAQLVAGPAGWLQSPGENRGIVVSSRVRLARNLHGRQFRRQLSTQNQSQLTDELLEEAGELLHWRDGLQLVLSELGPSERNALFERRLISREMVAGKHPCGVIVRDDERASLMINEEDHIRLQVMAPNLALLSCLEQAVTIDQRLERALPWAVHPRFGYLTSCPTNVGTGMRISVMLHLPAMAESKELAHALRAIAKLHLTVRGLFGEGSEASGHYYQVSNQRTLGLSEDEIARVLADAVASLVQYEELAREHMLRQRRGQIEDRIFRAWGTLTSARRLSSKELIEQLSWVRLGVSADLLANCDWGTLDRIFLQGQSAHVELQHPEAIEKELREEIRAGLVRSWLKHAA